LVCFFSSSGGRLLLLAPLGLRCLEFLTMVGCSGGVGTRGRVEAIAVLCRDDVGYILWHRFVLFTDFGFLEFFYNQNTST
jgi:hypothetical protein